MSEHEIDYAVRLDVDGYPPTEEGLKHASSGYLQFWRDYHSDCYRYSITDVTWSGGVWSFTINMVLFQPPCVRK